MQLVLAVLFVFMFVGLVPRRFDVRQQAIIVTVAIVLAMVQFTLTRFL
jgi:hypothetical protein